MNRKKIRKSCRYIAYILSGLMIILLLAAGGGALWLWGWTWKGAPTFHESWTAEERAALTEFDIHLRQQYAEDIIYGMMYYAQTFREIKGDEPISPGMAERLAAAYTARMVGAPIAEMLHSIAESGDASAADSVNFQEFHGITPAIIAAQTGHLKALEALVKHGADPNAIAFSQPDEYTEPMEIETPISPLLNGNFTNGRKLPWEQRRQTAEFLLAHGGNLNASRSINKLSCDMPLMLHEQNRIAPWEWALDHGMNMTPNNLGLIATFAEGRPVLERVLREKSMDINDVTGSGTVLQYLIRVLLRPYDEEMWRQEQPEKLLEEHLDLLLAAGANPNLIPREVEPQRPGESDEEYEERLDNSGALKDYPLTIATKALERAKLPAHRELCRRTIEKLKRDGARTTAE